MTSGKQEPERVETPDRVFPFRRSETRALLLVSLSVLLSSSIWFSGTAAVPSIRREWGLTDSESAWLTISVQLGFITGTFLYAFFNISDRFKARRVFFVSALMGAAANACFGLFAQGLRASVGFRFLTGLTLAGIYPVGMKIVAMWFQSGLGWRLGVLVGALTLGTASPYLIQAVGSQWSWRALVLTASLSAMAGGAVVLFGVSDGPYLKARARFDGRIVFRVFRSRRFRHTAFGYFGHMWELYAFWSLVTFYLGERFESGPGAWQKALPVLSFLTIGIGAIGCVGGGWLSRRKGERLIALVSLIISGCCCALSGFAFDMPPALLASFILIWGIFVVSDSPQFSALAAKYCPPEYTGTALTIQNGLGFAVTVASIQLLPLIAGVVGWRWAFVSLSVGPLLGAYFMRKVKEEATSDE